MLYEKHDAAFNGYNERNVEKVRAHSADEV
jgi:hypothetical protein